MQEQIFKLIQNEKEEEVLLGVDLGTQLIAFIDNSKDKIKGNNILTPYKIIENKLMEIRETGKNKREVYEAVYRSSSFIKYGQKESSKMIESLLKDINDKSISSLVGNVLSVLKFNNQDKTNLKEKLEDLVAKLHLD